MTALMRFFAKFALVSLMAIASFAQETAAPQQPASAPLCTGAYSPACAVSKSDQKKAHKAFELGLKLKGKGKDAEALDQFERASELVPRNVEYATAREVQRQAMVLKHVRRGNDLLAEGKQVEGIAELRMALDLDPNNQFTAESLQQAARRAVSTSGNTRIESTPAEAVELQPQPGVHSFHLRTDTRSLITQVARAYGITVNVDPQVQARPVRFNVDSADFATAMRLAGMLGKSFWVPLTEKSILVLNDDPPTRQAFEKFALQTFYIAGATVPQDLNEIVTTLRGTFDMRHLSVSTRENAIVVRGPKRLVDAAAALINSLSDGRPEVMLDIHIYQVSQSTLRSLGMDLPLQFQMFNIPAAGLSLGGTNLQDLVNQAISSGLINQANSQGIAALLAQLQNQQLSGIFKTPFATFGGGLTHFAVSIPPASLHLALTDSHVTTLDHMTLRADQGVAATARLGSRFPILNASFAPIFNNSAISQVIANQSFIAPFPSFNYEDLGLTLKATPAIHGEQDVTLKIETQIKSLGGSSLNGVPIINNREYNGTINLKNGQTAVVAGSVSEQDQRSLSGIPVLSNIPITTYAVSRHDKNVTEDELLVTITPHIMRVSTGQNLMQVISP